MINLALIFDNFRFIDFFDIFVVSFILYQFFKILHGTRAVRIFVGLSALTSLYWISLSMELYSLNWLLKHFFDYFFVILIILFQEQIRSALASFGRANIFLKKGYDLYSYQIEEVVSACGALSRDKTGALIVFERYQGLYNFSQTGTKLDCKIHSDILYSLFQVTSPLHDGAVILFQDRIQAAGCFLPLSKNLDLDRSLGTRHRAALGVSEVSDAIIVIVSEETGKMSICVGGSFTACVSENQLREKLRTVLLIQNRKENKIILRESNS